MPLLIAYALAIGSITAFVMPARDALLSEVAGEDLMKAVTAMTLVQWGSQAAGAFLGGSARWIGTVPALGLLAATFLAGAPTIARLAKAPPRTGAPHAALRLADLGIGVREVARSPLLRPVALLVTAVGALFVGPMMVVFPLLIRDYYGGDVAQLSWLQMCFPIGTILGSLALLARGGVRRKGLAQVASLVSGCASLGVVGFGLPLWGTLLAVVTWGVRRRGVHELRPHGVPGAGAARACAGRCSSVYMLGFMGASGLIGAPMSGLMVGWLGPLATLLRGERVDARGGGGGGGDDGDLAGGVGRGITTATSASEQLASGSPQRSKGVSPEALQSTSSANASSKETSANRASPDQAGSGAERSLIASVRGNNARRTGTGSFSYSHTSE